MNKDYYKQQLLELDCDHSNSTAPNSVYQIGTLTNNLMQLV